MRNQLSVVICTLNEEAVLDRCLRSVSWADELVICDSGSTDRTPEIAREHGAVLVEQEWLGFSAQKNFAAGRASHDWILSLDADEVVTDELARSIRDVLETPLDVAQGFVVDRRHDFLGTLLPNHARKQKRDRLVRLYNRTASHWDESVSVHEEVLCEGNRVTLPGLLLQWRDFELGELLERYGRYSRIEAEQLARGGASARLVDVLFRPLLRFGWHYVACGEWRLGTRGAIHAGLRAMNEYQRYALLWELQHPNKREGPPE